MGSLTETRTDEELAGKIITRMTQGQIDTMLRAERDGERWFIRWWKAGEISKREARQFRTLGIGFPVWSGFCLNAIGERVLQMLKSRK